MKGKVNFINFTYCALRNERVLECLVDLSNSPREYTMMQQTGMCRKNTSFLLAYIVLIERIRNKTFDDECL